jgi:hypothetical protein
MAVGACIGMAACSADAATGASDTGKPAYGTGSYNAAGQSKGSTSNRSTAPRSGEIGYRLGFWYDQDHRRHVYQYPADWQRYGHPFTWYRFHPHWDDRKDGDWYKKTSATNSKTTRQRSFDRGS